MIFFNEVTQSFISKQSNRLRSFILEKKLFAYNQPNILIADLEKNRLGEYCFDRKLIILSRKLMCLKQETIDHVLKHEYAHHCSMYQYGRNILPHGKEFASFCMILDISPKSKVDIQKMDIESKSIGDEELILTKIKKLISLSNSSNEYESKLALQKANDLMFKHNIKDINFNNKEIYQTYIFKGKRKSKKWNAIRTIVEKITGVYPIWNRYNDCVILEVNGDKESVEIADYLGSFLDREFERLYESAKKKHNLKGVNAKNSYFLNLAYEFVKSLDINLNNAPEYAESKTLVLKKKEAFHSYIKSFVYGSRRIRMSNSSYKMNTAASLAGKEDASNLNINHAINGNKKRLQIESK